MNYLIIALIIIAIIILFGFIIKITKFFLKILFISAIVLLLVFGFNYIKEKQQLECSLSRCDCKCYPSGKTPEEINNALCGVNCEYFYNITSCSVIDNECIEIINQTK